MLIVIRYMFDFEVCDGQKAIFFIKPAKSIANQLISY